MSPLDFGELPSNFEELHEYDMQWGDLDDDDYRRSRRNSRELHEKYDNRDTTRRVDVPLRDFFSWKAFKRLSFWGKVCRLVVWIYYIIVFIIGMIVFLLGLAFLLWIVYKLFFSHIIWYLFMS